MADDSTIHMPKPDPNRVSAGSDEQGRAGGDPLAELARLIGQDDLFERMRRDAQRAGHGAAAPATESFEPQPEPDLRGSIDPQPRAAAFETRSRVQEYEAPDYRAYQPQGRRTFEAPAPAQQAGYAGDDGYAGAYAADAAPQRQDHYTDPAYDPAYAYEDDSYVDEPPPPVEKRRSGGFMILASVLGLAVLGTAGAFGYRALTGGESGGQPPVIKAAATPAKVAPATAGRDQPERTTYDRTAGGQPERVVSREEQPIELREARVQTHRVAASGPSAGMVGMTGQSPGALTPPALAPESSSEPKKVKTISIRPDGSVSDQRPSRTAPAAAPTRTASIPPTPAQPAAPAATAGTHVVQVASQKTEADAQASYRTLQAKYPDVLGSREPLIRRVDLGERGVFFRVQVGPFASIAQANEMCGSLKSAGGQCIVQRN